MKILTVPNWSIHEPRLEEIVCDVLSDLEVKVHYAQSDPDHERAVIAFSGESDFVIEGLKRLCERLFPLIDMNQNHGVHPHCGALDVCPFVSLTRNEDLTILIKTIQEYLESRWDIPSRVYKDERRCDLPSIRKIIRKSDDSLTHPIYGTTIIGIRKFLLAVNINCYDIKLEAGHQLAKRMRHKRESGNPNFRGVRTLAFWLESQQSVQISMNMTDPDSTSFDTIHDWLQSQNVVIKSTELIGVIRKSDLPKSTLLKIDSAQIVD